MTKKLLILGAGQYGRLAKEIAEAMGIFDEISFLDDNSPLAIGAVSEYERFSGEYAFAAVAIGNPQVRLCLIDKLSECFEVVSLIHPMAYVSPSATLGLGCIIEPMTVVHTEAVLGAGCLICAGAVVNHAAKLEDGVQVDCNATVAGYALVPSRTKIESGMTYFENLKIY